MVSSNNGLHHFIQLLTPTPLNLPWYVMMFIPKKLRSDVDKSLSCLIFNFLAFCVIFNVIVTLSVEAYYSQTITKYLVMMSISIVLLGSFPLLLYLTSAIDILIHPLLILIFISNFTRTSLCGQFAIMVASPIRIITLYATFLQCSKKSLCFYFVLCMSSWVYFFLITPFPYPPQTCGMPHHIINYVVGTLMIFTITLMAFIFSKIRNIKNELLILQRDRASLAAQLYIDFTKHTSHEVRTPLFTVIGYIDMLVDDPRLVPEHKEILLSILQAGERLNKQLSAVLNFSDPSKAYGMRTRNLEKDVNQKDQQDANTQLER
eukprot:TRINITY_DN4681_c0_g1_i1.p1 TRINITY_DN4681_c0_g1~~TRINITY_DN4681_c0_g1_i1.p1  ORF type:complete len:319 (-),score=30.83 TRINITY_DN4681_c0_g1_i1:213-1169(-)